MKQNDEAIKQSLELKGIGPKQVNLKSLFLNLWLDNNQLILVWLALRLFFLLSPFIAFLILGNQAKLIADNEPIGGFWTDKIIGSWMRWDGRWYVLIAEQGYQNEALAAFYPVYPAVIWAFTSLFTLGIKNPALVGLFGIIISSISTLAAGIILYKLFSLDYQTKVSRLSVFYLLIFPTSFFLFAVYTESLFLALAAGSFYLARKDFWFWSILAASAAVLTKNQGILLVFALAVEYGYGKKWRIEKLAKHLHYFLLPALLFLVWCLFNYIRFGNPIQFLISNQKYWERYFAWPWQTLVTAVESVFSDDSANLINTIALEIPVTLLFIFLAGFGLWLVKKGRFRFSYWVYFILCLLQPLSLPRAEGPLYALPRYLIIIFPAFVLLALVAQRYRIAHYLYVFLCLPILFLETILFNLAFWVA